MADQNRKLLFGLVVVLLIAIYGLQSKINPVAYEMDIAGQPVGKVHTGDMMLEMPGQFIIASMTGFRQVVAGAFWIRADDFFHRGQYQAIIPIVRIVTWLDPHNIDVYTTGAWHLDYNFVDEANQMSDKRYIPASIALLKEGIRNNPDIWDLYFELGWSHYSKKLMDNDQALIWIKKACEHGARDANTGEKAPRPEFVDRMLAHAYEKAGRLDEAVEQWHASRKIVENLLNLESRRRVENYYTDNSSLDVCDRNLALLLLRRAWRYGDMKAYKDGLDVAERVARNEDNGWIKSGKKGQEPQWAAATRSARTDYEKRLAANNPPKDALKPLDTNFQVEWKKAAPKVLLIKGKINLAPISEYKDLASEAFTHWYANNSKTNADRKQLWRDGSRINWRLEDADYKMLTLESFNWKIDTSKTVAWDSIYVGGGTFSERIDLSDPRDAEMYPFKAKSYKLTIWVTPEQPGVPDYIQDRIGWRGEALTDKNYLDTTTRPGFHMLKKVFYLKRSDIL